MRFPQPRPAVSAPLCSRFEPTHRVPVSLIVEICCDLCGFVPAGCPGLTQAHHGGVLSLVGPWWDLGVMYVSALSVRGGAGSRRGAAVALRRCHTSWYVTEVMIANSSIYLSPDMPSLLDRGKLY